MVFKVNEGRPNIADEIVNNKVDLVVNTPLGRESFFDDRAVRRAAMMYEVPCITTLTGAAAAVSAIRAMREQGIDVRALQDYYAGIARSQNLARSQFLHTSVPLISDRRRPRWGACLAARVVRARGRCHSGDGPSGRHCALALSLAPTCRSRCGLSRSARRRRRC